MSETIENNAASAGQPGRVFNIVLWVLQIALVLMFLMAGFSKIAGAAPMVEMFDRIGVGQWFRYLTGVIEVLGAILLLVPRFCGAGALLLTATMIGAVLTHLFVIGGSPVMPIILLLVAGIIAWGRRARTANILG